MAGVLLLILEISASESTWKILSAVVSNIKVVCDGKSPPGRKFVNVVPVEFAKIVSPSVKSSLI